MTGNTRMSILEVASSYLEEHREELAEKIAKYYKRYIPAFSTISNSDFFEEVRDELQERITLMAKHMAGEKEIGHLSSEFFKRLVERRLVQGIPFSELLGAYIMGKNLILNALRKELLTRELEKEEIFQFFKALTDATESVLIPMALTYEDTQCHLDSLTHCYNHSFLQESLLSELQKAREEKDYLSLIVIDIDGFRRFNECNGFRQSDLLLRELSQVLLEMLSPEDILSRYGGDRFIALLAHRHKSQALRMANKIMKQVSGHEFYLGGECARKITVSVGVASYPDDGEERSALIEKGFTVLQAAKKREEK